MNTSPIAPSSPAPHGNTPPAPHLPDPKEIDLFRTELPRGSHPRNFAVDTLAAYARSEGLCGFDGATFGTMHDIPGAIAKGVVPNIIQQLYSAGILVKPPAPFDVYLGQYPSPRFISAVLSDRSILHHLTPLEAAQVDKLTSSIADTSQECIERRWLVKIASAFLHVPHGDPLSLSNFMKLLPEFDGKERRVPTLLAMLHERDIITFVQREGASEIFNSGSLLDLLDDTSLVEKLRDPGRTVEPFPFILMHRREGAARSSAEVDPSQKPQSSAPSVRSPVTVTPAVRQAIAAATTTVPDTGGNSAGREVRAAVLATLEKTPTVKVGDLLKELKHLAISEDALRYHLTKLCDDGRILKEGRGSKAIISLTK